MTPPRPVQPLTKLPLELSGKRRSIRSVAQQKAANRKQQDAGDVGIDKTGRGDDLIVSQKAYVQIVEEVGAKDVSPVDARMMVAHEIVRQS